MKCGPSSKNALAASRLAAPVVLRSMEQVERTLLELRLTRPRLLQPTALTQLILTILRIKGGPTCHPAHL